MLPLLYPRKALQDRAYRFGTAINAGDGLTRIQIVSSRLTDPTFWTSYQDMIQQFTSLFSRNDEHRRDLNAIAIALDDRMDDVRNTFHDLRQEERETFHAIAKDLLPVTKHVTTEELERNPESLSARCTVCGLPFSLKQQEPPTPAFCTYAPAHNREEQVHTAMRYQECAYVPHQHAFCLREWARQLMSRGADNAITGIKAKAHWRCSTCFVDPWRAG
ncbi:hypothetical protein UCDDA912_g00345 [Diaporthe ampelina]|uniref:Uncharacterized protein n=1 Tax=Diaporthe ampelina TaxID=1214573 RepID=A0A0G2FZW8_9PEZI|nr:hypothetical protein UCDDA912_g00345 [Diaporthe ampelina]